MANRSVVLYLRTKIKKKWAYRKAAEVLSKLGCGEYYLSWYDGKRKRLDSAGSDPEAALNALQKKRLELAYVAAGGEIKQPDVKKSLESVYLAVGGQIQSANGAILSLHPASSGEAKQGDDGQRKLVTEAVKDYLADRKDRQGKSGYGLATRTPKTYENRLCYLTEFMPEAHMDEVTPEFIKGFRRFLRNHGNDLTDRTSYNVMQAVSTFLNKNSSGVAKPFLAEEANSQC